MRARNRMLNSLASGVAQHRPARSFSIRRDLGPRCEVAYSRRAAALRGRNESMVGARTDQMRSRSAMVNRNLMRQFDLPDAEFNVELDAAFAGETVDWLAAEGQDFREGRVVTGVVRRVSNDDVWVDVGQKSEGAIELREWYDDALGKIVPPKAGDVVEVLLEAAEDEDGAVVLSFRKARRQKQWEDLIARVKEGDVVSVPSRARSRAACWSTSASAPSCPPRRPTSGASPISARSSARRSNARSSPSTRTGATSSSRAGNSSKTSGRSGRGSCSPRLSSARRARASSRISSPSAPSSTSAASTACCTSAT